jgi:hypothetical protein
MSGSKSAKRMGGKRRVSRRMGGKRKSKKLTKSDVRVLQKILNK